MIYLIQCFGQQAWAKGSSRPCRVHANLTVQPFLEQDLGARAANGSEPGWLDLEWIKINNLTDPFNIIFSADEDAQKASGGGFGLRQALRTKK